MKLKLLLCISLISSLSLSAYSEIDKRLKIDDNTTKNTQKKDEIIKVQSQSTNNEVDDYFKKTDDTPKEKTTETKVDKDTEMKNYIGNEVQDIKPNSFSVNHRVNRAARSNMFVQVTDSKNSEAGKLTQISKDAYDAFHSNQYEVAIYCYRQILAKDPKDYNALFGLATTMQMLKQNDEAIIIYKKLINMKQDNIKVVNNFLVAVSNLDRDKALETLIAIDKSIGGLNPLIIGQIGTVYIKLGMFENAIQYLTKAMELTTTNALYAYNLAIAYEATKQNQYAVYYYKFAIQNGIGKETDIDISKIQNKISQLEADLAKKKT